MGEETELGKRVPLGRVDEALFQYYNGKPKPEVDRCELRSSSAKMRATGRLVEQGRKKFNEY